MPIPNIAMYSAGGNLLHTFIAWSYRRSSDASICDTPGERLLTVEPVLFEGFRAEQAFDRTTHVVIDYLARDPSDARPNAAWREPWNHLVAILHTAARDKSGKHLFVPSDRFRVQYSRDRPDVFEYENYETNHWIETWLVAKLAAFQGKSQAAIYEAAVRGEFRNLANDCRCDLINEINRRNNPKRNPGGPLLSLDEALDSDDEDSEVLADYIVKPCVIDPVDWIEANRHALNNNGVYDVTKAITDQFLVGGDTATKVLALHWGVGLRQAQRRGGDVLSRIRTQLRDTSIIRDLYSTLDAYANREAILCRNSLVDYPQLQ